MFRNEANVILFVKYEHIGMNLTMIQKYRNGYNFIN
jgi:hypothetical protein